MLVTLHLVIHPCVEFALIAYYLSLNKLHCLAAGSVATKIKWKAIGILCRCGSTVLHVQKTTLRVTGIQDSHQIPGPHFKLCY